MSALFSRPPAATELPIEFQEEEQSLNITGFWLFLVTDVLIFASLFSSYAVFRPMVAQGPGPAQVFHLGPVIAETLILLTSSFTIGIAVWAMRTGRTRMLQAWLIFTMVLGALFVGLELREFVADATTGAGWQVSAFLSAFFLLVSTHGAHVTFGILWALALLVQIWRRGITPVTARKLYTFSLYWHFLDIVWVFIFTFVYLGGKIT
jgi:cytochrome aa3-600 menaquinol oxidase subunit 3